MKSEICANCGHSSDEHLWAIPKSDEYVLGPCTYDNPICLCKKFTPPKVVKRSKNGVNPSENNRPAEICANCEVYEFPEWVGKQFIEVIDVMKMLGEKFTPQGCGKWFDRDQYRCEGSTLCPKCKPQSYRKATVINDSLTVEHQNHSPVEQCDKEPEEKSVHNKVLQSASGSDNLKHQNHSPHSSNVTSRVADEGCKTSNSFHEDKSEPGVVTSGSDNLKVTSSLSSKICLGSIEHTKFLIPEDVKSAVKKLKEELSFTSIREIDISNKIDKIFGEELSR